LEGFNLIDAPIGFLDKCWVNLRTQINNSSITPESFGEFASLSFDVCNVQRVRREVDE
jgi:hypothetical protein